MTLYVIFDKYIIQSLLALGVLGNIFMLIILSQLFYGGYFKRYWRHRVSCCVKDESNSNTTSEELTATSTVTLQMSIYLFFLAISDIGFLISAFLCQENFKQKFANCHDNNVGQTYVNAFKGVSDIIVTFMTYHRLHSIWNIQTHNSDAISFRRIKQKIWNNNSGILIQIVSAFVIGFFFHIPFFVDYNSENGACDFYELSPGFDNFHDIKDSDNWQTPNNCSIFLWIHITALKIIPTFLIVSFNVAIAWKLREVWKKRQTIRKNAIQSLKIRIWHDASPRNRPKQQDNNYLCEPQNHLQLSVSSEEDTLSTHIRTSDSPSIERTSQIVENLDNVSVHIKKFKNLSSSTLSRIQKYARKKRIACQRDDFTKKTDEIMTDTILNNELPFNISSKVTITVSTVQQMNRNYDKYLKQKESNCISQMNKGHLTPVMKMKQGKMARIQNNANKKKLARQKENLKNDTERIIMYSILSIVTAGMFLLCTLLSNIPLFSYPINHKPFPWFTRNYLIIQHLLESLNYTCNFLIYCVANSDTRHAARNLIKTISRYCMIPLKWTLDMIRYLHNWLNIYNCISICKHD